MTDKHVNLNNARLGVYAQVIEKIGKDNICPFCIENLGKIHPHPLDERKFWTITDNAYPYIPKKEHLLIIHREHIDDVSKLSEEAWTELKNIINELKEKRKITGGSFIMRFGETKFTGASVTHLHAHLFQPDPDNPEYDKKKGVVTRIG